MTTVFSIIAVVLAAALIALCLPRVVTVERSAQIAMPPAEALELIASTDGFQTFNPYKTTDPKLVITPFGPDAGVGSGFRFEGKEGKGTQTVTAVTETSVTHLIDLGPMGQPVQTFTVTPHAGGSEVVWSVTSDLGMNPIFRVFGLFMDRMLGKTYELGLRNLAKPA
ncbi:SRPBCC family protein [Shimia ponticola]|uniref:SRPBCC family protein n=1 Tax=Shimia ponticola TaxID=2582893 RepID=UPI0011BEFDE8|nr:SRPBCC family protein [Shimia ponticola]